jgi:hypothetical protein
MSTTTSESPLTIFDGVQVPTEENQVFTIEPAEYVGAFPIRQDITVLPADEPPPPPPPPAIPPPVPLANNNFLKEKKLFRHRELPYMDGATKLPYIHIPQGITVLPGDDPQRLRLGWVIHEEIGVVMVNTSYSMNSISLVSNGGFPMNDPVADPIFDIIGFHSCRENIFETNETPNENVPTPAMGWRENISDYFEEQPEEQPTKTPTENKLLIFGVKHEL